MKPKPEAILFDLDNTLILFDENDFFRKYTSALTSFFADMIEPTLFVKRLLDSTQQMVYNNGLTLNIDFFMNSFTDGLDLDTAVLLERFDQFYMEKFNQLSSVAKPIDHASDVVTDLARKGYRLVIASNPLLPLEAQWMRMKWAGVADIDYDLVTGIDNSSFCKPRIEYYHEICRKINLPPATCLMVGNDPYNDIIASTIGMSTYLTTDSEHMSIELSRELAAHMELQFPVPDG
ncbi:HAD family hydrolase, partial [candidate division KSB1 bacterium]|nr:HAD family hydrolase [candidate division KSB1 bacterium]